MILETKRLYLRLLRPSDLPDLRKTLQDPIAMRAYEHAFSDEECIEWLKKQQKRYEEDGFGLWAVVLKDADELIGQCGITYQMVDGQKVVEIGYLFERKYWHNGYAIESAQACKQYAFDQLQVDAVYSIIRPSNEASIRVALKNGMKLKTTITKHYYGMDMPHNVYWIENPK